MRKILALVTLLLFGLLTSAQSDDIFYGRAQELYVGFSDGEKINWLEDPAYVDILIKIKGNKITIYSREIQEYHVISLAYEDEKSAKWYCSDGNGINCYFYMAPYGFREEKIGIIVEYNDMAWSYICVPE
jgi:hypothetical protein